MNSYYIIVLFLLSSYRWFDSIDSSIKYGIVNAVPNAQTHYLNQTLIKEMIAKGKNSTRDAILKQTLKEAAGI